MARRIHVPSESHRDRIPRQKGAGSGNRDGFTLAELLIALLITAGLSTIVFQLFQQNERVFRDQNLLIEMQQSARVVASQISDEIRMAGQGVPLYAASFDSVKAEATAPILSSSN